MGVHTIVIDKHKHWRGVRSKTTSKRAPELGIVVGIGMNSPAIICQKMREFMRLGPAGPKPDRR